MKRLNLLKKYPHYYSSKEAPELIEVEKAKFISIHAKGSFTDKIFYDRIEALTLTADAVKELFENSDQAFDVSVLEEVFIGMTRKNMVQSAFPVFTILSL